MSIAELYQIYLAHPSVQTDSRNIKKGDLFFALKGPNFNGNLFAQKAIETGAYCVIVDEPISFKHSNIFIVTDVLQTLQQLALHHRQQLNIPFIAITGSNGKTTTKELVHVVLSTKYKTSTTVGNLNNHIGIPLTILKVKTTDEIAVIEMGANHQKEIENYCTYTLPTHGLITNCGKAHLEGFGGEEGVKKGKGELFDYLAAHNGVAFVMWDYDYLQTMSSKILHIKKYGTLQADVIGTLSTKDQFLSVLINDEVEINTQLVGDYNLPNVLAAVCIGQYFGVTNHNIKNAIEQYTPSNSRSQLITKGSNTIILDAYNANPSSMKLAIENLAKMDGENKILLLGSMMELGEESEAEHKNIIEIINQYKWKQVVLVGQNFNTLHHHFIHLNNAAEAKNWFENEKITNSTILIKGSRSMQMEKILEG
jgi:UDP-N-acetylmuramoyl-tripeptide--D-alanyl-D-alanine ligase